MKDFAFITVQYNNPADTELFLSSVGRLQMASECEVIVVDNSDSPSAGKIPGEADALHVRTIRPEKNLFYWGGAKFALESLYGVSGPWPAWTLVCNNDVEIIDDDFLHRLKRLDPLTHPIVAPRIVSQATGIDQNPILDTYPGRMKRFKWRVYDVSYPLAMSMLAIHRAVRFFQKSAAGTASSALSSSMERRIYAPHGACMIFSSAFFERGGKLDTQVPLFAEELTIAALAEKLDMPVWYCPDIRISHREHSTTGQTLTRAKYEMERMARRRYYEYGR